MTAAVKTGQVIPLKNLQPRKDPLTQVNQRRPAPDQRRVEQGQNRAFEALKRENAELKKGQSNMQIMAELKYTRSQVESLKKSLAERDATIASLQADARKNLETIELGALQIQELEAKLNDAPPISTELANTAAAA